MNAAFDLTALRERLTWQVSRLPLRQHFVLLLCVVACVLTVFRATALHQEVRSAETRLRYETAGTPGAAPNTKEQSRPAQFLDFFPHQDPAEDFLKQVYSAAEKHGIKVSHVSLEAAPQSVAGLHQQNMAMTLTAPDDSYRELIYALLARHPAMTLTHLAVNQGERGDFLVDLVWGVYAR